MILSLLVVFLLGILVFASVLLLIDATASADDDRYERLASRLTQRFVAEQQSDRHGPPTVPMPNHLGGVRRGDGRPVSMFDTTEDLGVIEHLETQPINTRSQRRSLWRLPTRRMRAWLKRPY